MSALALRSIPAELLMAHNQVSMSMFRSLTLGLSRNICTSSACYIKAHKPKPKLPLEVTPEFFEKRQRDKEYPNLWQGKIIRSTIDSLKDRGFCVARKPYSPPENTEDTLYQLSQEVFGNKLDPNWQDTSLENPLLKYKILTRCEEHFGHYVPSPQLYTIEKLEHLVNFYLTPVQGILAYDKLVQSKDSLPPNLHVIAEPVRFHPETDTIHDGISAYPGESSYVVGLKTRKKYRGFKATVKWPDV